MEQKKPDGNAVEPTEHPIIEITIKKEKRIFYRRTSAVKQRPSLEKPCLAKQERNA